MKRHLSAQPSYSTAGREGIGVREGGRGVSGDGREERRRKRGEGGCIEN
jgi:hypothetical protein